MLIRLPSHTKCPLLPRVSLPRLHRPLIQGMFDGKLSSGRVRRKPGKRAKAIHHQTETTVGGLSRVEQEAEGKLQAKTQVLEKERIFSKKIHLYEKWMYKRLFFEDRLALPYEKEAWGFRAYCAELMICFAFGFFQEYMFFLILD